jgi:hypothetical protein
MNWNEVCLNPFTFQQNNRPADHQLADPATAKATANGDAFGVPPFFEGQEAAYNAGKSLGEILDRSLHDARGLGLSMREQGVELGLTKLIAFFVAERIVTRLAE